MLWYVLGVLFCIMFILAQMSLLLQEVLLRRMYQTMLLLQVTLRELSEAQRTCLGKG